MTAVVVLVVVVVLAAVAFGAYRQRPAHTIESGISSFRREMRALAPPRKAGDPPPPDQTRPEQYRPDHLRSSRPDSASDQPGPARDRPAGPERPGDAPHTSDEDR